MRGPVELDESYCGGKEKNKHVSKRTNRGRGTAGKSTVAGARDHASRQISAAVVPGGGRVHRLECVVQGAAEPHIGQPRAGRVREGQAHTNGLESFWTMMKRGYYGTYHRMSPAHLQRYVNEFAGRHNQRPYDNTEVQMRMVVQGMERKRI